MKIPDRRPINNSIVPREEGPRSGKYVYSYLKAIKREFKILVLYLNMLKQQIFWTFNRADEAKYSIEDLKNRIRHERGKEAKDYYRLKLGSNLLVTSRNLPKREVYKEAVLLTQKDFKFLESGICAGACLDFAGQVLDGSNVEQIAGQYKSGLGICSIQNQVNYEKSELSLKTQDKLSYLMDSLETEGKLKGEDKLLIRALVQAVFLNDSSVIKSEKFKNLYGDYSHLTDDILKEKPNSLEKIAVSVLEQLKPNMSKIPTHNQNTKKITRLFSNILGHRQMASEKKLRVLKWVHLFRRTLESKTQHLKLNESAKERELQLEQKKQIGGLKNDRDYLNGKLDSEGTYYLSIKTKRGGHATLYINTGNEKFFWDPNIGLIKLDFKHPEELILRTLNFYQTSDKKEPENHMLVMRKVTKIT